MLMKGADRQIAYRITCIVGGRRVITVRNTSRDQDVSSEMRFCLGCCVSKKMHVIYRVDEVLGH